MNKFFPTQWPIMCAVMTGASDLNLALAVHEAGAMPSLIIDRYNHNNNIDHDLVYTTLKEFQTNTGNCNLVLAVAEEDLLDVKFFKLLKEFNVSHLEILGNEINCDHYWHSRQFTNSLKLVRSFAKVMVRVFKPVEDNSNVDAFCIKGKESGGFVGNYSVKEIFEQQVKILKNKNLIPYGGVGSPEHVKYYIDRGASAVAVGTLFAASMESCLSTESKKKICEANSKDLKKFSDTGQQALIFSDQTLSQEDWNRSCSLNAGLNGNGTQGHIYLGTSVDYVTEIRSVKTIVEYLVSDIKEQR